MWFLLLIVLNAILRLFFAHVKHFELRYIIKAALPVFSTGGCGSFYQPRRAFGVISKTVRGLMCSANHRG